MSEPTCKLETITPQLAKQYLATNPQNRSLKESSLGQYTAEHRKDNWQVTGETVIFCKEGKLRDGFHRLESSVRANKPMRTFVVRGISKEAVNFIDSGISRTPADVLTINEIEYGTELASMTRFIIFFKSGLYGHAANSSGKKELTTNNEIFQFVNKNKSSLLESMPYGFTKGTKITTPSIISGLHFILKSKNYDAADTFCHKLAQGGNLTKSSPINRIRELLENDRVNRFNRNRTEKLALICKAWNLFRDDKQVASISFNHLEEEFPKLK